MTTTTVEKAQILSPSVIKEIEVWLKKYPADQRQSVLLPALRFTQEDNKGYLTEELICAVADYIGIPHIAAFEVATFYCMYDLEPVGQHKITVCDNICCKLRDADKIVSHIESRIGVKKGNTSKDGRYTFKTVECMGACVDAPVMQIDDRNYYGKLTPEKVDEILDNIEKQEDKHGK